MPSDTYYLIGSDDVRSGGHAAERGGNAMQSAAYTMEYALRDHARALENHQNFLNEWLERYAQITRDGAARQPAVSCGGPL